MSRKATLPARGPRQGSRHVDPRCPPQMHAPPHTIQWVGCISSGIAVTLHIPGTRRITEETVWACPPEKWRERGPHPSDFSTRSGALASPGAVQGPSLLVNQAPPIIKGTARAICPPQAQSSPLRQALSLVLPLHHTGRRRRAPAHLFDNMVITKWDLYGGARGWSRRVSSKGQEMQGVSSD